MKRLFLIPFVALVSCRSTEPPLAVTYYAVTPRHFTVPKGTAVRVGHREVTLPEDTSVVLTSFMQERVALIVTEKRHETN